MKPRSVLAILLLLLAGPGAAVPIPLFDGATLAGWEGNTETVWRVREGAIVGGSLEGNARNEFLATTRAYGNFRLSFEYKLLGTEGFVNGGVQFRSRRLDDPPNEMAGYQADIGAGYTGFLYDESRRNRMLAEADPRLMESIEKPGDWNRYEIVAQGAEIELSVNGRRTVSWVEPEDGMAREGLIALQIHGGCKAEIFFRNLLLEELPAREEPGQAEILRRFGEGQPAMPRPPFPGATFQLEEGEVVVFAGQENLVREQKSGALESLLALGFASRNPRFRSMAWEADTVYEQWRDLNFGSWLRQLQTAEAGVVVAQFGQIEALDGVERLTGFTVAYHRLLDEFAAHTGRLVLLSPMPFEKPLAPGAPDLRERNGEVRAYVEAIREIARQRGAVFVDLFTPLTARGADAPRLTEDGLHLTAAGLEEVARIVAGQLGARPGEFAKAAVLRQAIVEKNRAWFDCWRPANWSFAYGDRVAQAYGKSQGEGPSLQESFELRRPLIAELDARIHALARGGDPAPRSPEVPSASDSPAALTPEQELAGFQLADGYTANLFASEADGVRNPTQFAWDERGRLYVACSPMYPQAAAGGAPSDYVLVLQDTDGDGRADQSWRFAEGLTMVQGLEPGPGGLYVCDFDQLVFLADDNGDGKADSRRILFSGFGIGDTHQLINSICHGPDGSLWFTQGLHALSLVETPWGIARLDRAGLWRMRPRSLRLEGFFGGGMAGLNCWGVAFDDFGQVFHKSGDRPHGYWSVPGLVRGADPSGSGSRSEANQSYADSPLQYHGVGPLFETSPKTTSLEIIGTRALPEEIQGCALIGGYFGSVVELHRLHDEGSGFRSTQLPKLLRSSNDAFRPVDVSVGPDGAMYVADWYNPVIGHYQASHADPRRDKAHGRIWRISAKGYAPIRQPDLAAMSCEELLGQLRSPERWTRAQAKRLLFHRPTAEVLEAADRWLADLPADIPERDRLLREAIGVYEAHDAVRPDLLRELIDASDFRVRAYAARVVGAWAPGLDDPLGLLGKLVRDEHPRVRLEAVVAASYVPKPAAIAVATEALHAPMDPFLDYALRLSSGALLPHWKPALEQGVLELSSPAHTDYLRALAGASAPVPTPGAELYTLACLTCHQPEGEGLPGVYPPLAHADWVSGDPERLIKILLHGLRGPLTLNGKPFESNSPIAMPAFAGLQDEQIAQVLTFIRNEFGNAAPAVTAEQVGAVRAATANRDRPWTEDEF